MQRTSGVVRGVVFAASIAMTSHQLIWAQINPVPQPRDVSGKAISDWTLTGDQESTGTQNPHMTRSWKGDSTTTDSIDYSNSLSSFGPGMSQLDVDALANFADLFFDDVVNDISTLLVSPRVLQDDLINGGTKDIFYQTATPYGAVTGVWAHNAPDIGGGPPPGNIAPEGIDGLEVWGSDGDHNMFSLYQDPAAANDPLQRGISVFQYDPKTDTSSPYIYNDDLRGALGLNPLDPIIDLDGMMVFDTLGDGLFNAGDSILLTVAENGQFHGGEIWVWSFGSAATFLQHGGVLWDTANQPSLLFNWAPDPITGLAANDINALESIFSVPEPGNALLLAICCGLAITGRRRSVATRPQRGRAVHSPS
jgi:hypothetical protein